MTGRFSRSLELARASWSVVRADKELLLLPVLSVVALVLILGSFVVPYAALGGFRPDAAGGPPVAQALAAFCFYVVAYFVTIFFNTALVGAAMVRLQGGSPRLADALGIAWQRAGRIFGYACIAATVGMLLRAIEERVGWLGQIVVRLIGVGWTLATFLVVPVLVTRDMGPVEAVKESAGLLRGTWGENLIGNVGLGLAFGIAYFGLVVVGVLGVMLAVQAQLPVVAALVALVAIVAFFVLSALHATLQGVYSAALYRFATEPGAAPPGFPAQLLGEAFRHRS